MWKYRKIDTTRNDVSNLFKFLIEKIRKTNWENNRRTEKRRGTTINDSKWKTYNQENKLTV